MFMLKLLTVILTFHAFAKAGKTKPKIYKPYLVLKKHLEAVKTVKHLDVLVKFSGLVIPASSASFLEGKSVATGTLKDYLNRAVAFCQWCLKNHCPWVEDSDLDMVLVLYLDFLFFHGSTVDAGSKLLASLKFLMPRFTRGGEGKLPRTLRALGAWHKLRPNLQRLPFPWLALMAVVGYLTFSGKVWEAFYLIVQFRTYIRPGVFARLKSKQLTPPAGEGGRNFGLWYFNLNPVEDLIPGKTGLYDQSVVWDTEAWAAMYFYKLVAQAPETPMWPFSHVHLLHAFTEACTVLGLLNLKPCLYGLRHGGASDDLLQDRRALLEVKDRGGWASDASLKRYGKRARITGELHKIPREILSYGCLVGSHLEAVFVNRIVFKPPNLVVLPVVNP
jgi:hypothetical protein